MLDYERSRDVIILFKGATITVEVTPEDAANGWAGGQGFQWKADPSDRLIVTKSDGLYGGFALWGSDESSDKFVATTQNQPAYRYIVLAAGGWMISTHTFEQYTYASRIGPGPLVPITYTPSDRLVFSLRGLFTKEDEWTLSGDPRGANKYYIGFVVQKPTVERNGFMTIQVSI